MGGKSSKPKSVVLSCPDAVCKGATGTGNGQCECGPKCKLDKYSGTCCQDVIDIRGDKFCIEYTEPPSNPSMRKGLECKAREQVFEQDGKRVVIPAQKICEWCAQSVVDTKTELETDAPTGTEGFASVDVLGSFMY